MKLSFFTAAVLAAIFAAAQFQPARAQAASAQAGAAQKAPDMAAVITVDAPVFVLNHVRVVDGTGALAQDDQTVVVANGKIQSIGPAGSAQIPQGAQQFDKTGYTVTPAWSACTIICITPTQFRCSAPTAESRSRA